MMEAETSEDRTPVSEEEDASATSCCLGVALAVVLGVKLLHRIPIYLASTTYTYYTYLLLSYY